MQRLRRYKETVAKTLSWGLAGTRWTQRAFRSLLSFDRRCLPAMTARRRKADEGWVAYYRRQHQFLRRTFARMGVNETGFDVLVSSHGWYGHMVRLPPHQLVHAVQRHETRLDWKMQQAAGEIHDQ